MSLESNLEHSHDPAHIARRLATTPKHQYVSDGVLGGIDGCVTTFAVVSSAVGAGLSSTVALIMGLANLFADGISMAVSNYESVKAQQDYVNDITRIEESHIDQVPDGEREEIRQIFVKKGFSGTTLAKIVETICDDRRLWIDTMLADEYGVIRSQRSPWRSAGATLGAFVLVGTVPLLPFLYSALTLHRQYIVSAVLAAVMFFSVGMLKAISFNQSIFIAGMKTLLTGSVAASIAFMTGFLLRHFFNL